MIKLILINLSREVQVGRRILMGDFIIKKQQQQKQKTTT